MNQFRWDRHFLNLAEEHAKMSKDPSTHAGAIIVGKDRSIRSLGFNGFPAGIIDSAERYANRDLKYRLVVHAEMNAILLAARHGTSVNDCVMYVVANDVKTGLPWGGPPCIRCAMEVIQSGIKTVVFYPRQGSAGRWLTDRWPDGTPMFPEDFFNEAKILLRQVPLTATTEL